MAIEVRELIIRATVSQEGAEKNGEPAQQSEGANNDVSPNEEMITTCVEKILEILKSKNDR